MSGAVSCSDCGAALKPDRRRKGTRCKPCTARAVSRDPATRAKVSAAMKRNWCDPAQRRRRVESMTEANRSPEMVALRRDLGRQLNNIVRFARPLPAGHPSRVQAGQALTERRIGWCPLEYRDEYQRLKEHDGFSAPAARQIIEGQIARDLERYVATGVLQRTGREPGVRS